MTQRRPVPHHLRPDMAAASAPSPDTDRYPVTGMDEPQVGWTSETAGGEDVGGSSHLATGMVSQAAGRRGVPRSPVSRRLMSVEGLTGAHEEDMSCHIRSPGRRKDWGPNVPLTTGSRVIASVTRTDGIDMSRRHPEELLLTQSLTSTFSPDTSPHF